MTLGADRGTKEDQVLGNRSVDDVHASHGAAGVVKHPLGLDAKVVLVDVRRRLGVGTQVVENVVKDGRSVARVLGDGGRGDLVDPLVIKDVEARANRVESSDESAEADEESRDQHPAALGSRRGAVGALGGAGTVGRHDEVEANGPRSGMMVGRTKQRKERDQVKTVMEHPKWRGKSEGDGGTQMSRREEK